MAPWRFDDRWTVEQLERAFARVRNPVDWQGRISAYCLDDEVEITAAAIEFFTGTTATFADVAGSRLCRVESVGFRIGVAART